MKSGSSNLLLLVAKGTPYLFKFQGPQNVSLSLVVGNKTPAKTRDGKIREIREAVSMSIVGMESNAKLESTFEELNNFGWQIFQLLTILAPDKQP